MTLPISRNFLERIAVSAALFLIITAVVFLAPLPYFDPIVLGLLALLGVKCLLELFSLMEAKKLQPAKKTVIIFFLLFLLSIYYAQRSTSFLPAACVFLLFSLTLFLLAFKEQKTPILNISASHFAFLFLALPISLLVAILYCPLWKELGPFWLLFLIVTTKCTDIGGYVIGKLFGKRKLAPTLSPNKTWEGAIGGGCLCIAVSFIFQKLAPFTTGSLLTPLQAIALGGIIGVFAQIGDLSESLLKRDAAKKDSSSLPGIGGMLDTVDSLIFTIPLVYIFLLYQYSH
jgi:phosphatidate cytidylyltransferase